MILRVLKLGPEQSHSLFGKCLCPSERRNIEGAQNWTDSYTGQTSRIGDQPLGTQKASSRQIVFVPRLFSGILGPHALLC